MKLLVGSMTDNTPPALFLEKLENLAQCLRKRTNPAALYTLCSTQIDDFVIAAAHGKMLSIPERIAVLTEERRRLDAEVFRTYGPSK